jgi:hypothetical protein
VAACKENEAKPPRGYTIHINEITEETPQLRFEVYHHISSNQNKTNMTRMSQPTPQHIRTSVERGKEQDLQENEDCARQVESRHF